MLPTSPRVFTDTSRPDSGVICPPPGDALVDWLSRAIPLGAPAYWAPIVELPITRPPAAVPESDRDAADLERVIDDNLGAAKQRKAQTVAGALQRADVHIGYPARTVGAALERAGVDDWRARTALMDMLAPSPLGPDGLPASWPHHPPGTALHLAALDSLWHVRNVGMPGRAIVAAVAIDLAGEDRGAISARLGLETEVPTGKGAATELVSHERHRSLERYLAVGRPLLAELGAWPWTHGDEGRLPRDWWALRSFLGPLARWHHDAWMATAWRLDAAAGVIAGETHRRRSLKSHQALEGIYQRR